MGEATGFIKWSRETPTRRPIPVRLLDDWAAATAHFRKVVPQDYKRVLEVMNEAAALGLSDDETAVKVMEAAHG